MKRILITGGAGFVGRHFTKYWLEQGAHVDCIDPIADFTGGIHPQAGWPLFDPREFNNFHFQAKDCRVFFKENSGEYYDYAFHLAAMVGGRMMIEYHPLAVADDLSIDSEFWQWAKQAQPAKTICFSSSAAYPVKLQRPTGYQLLTEDLISFDDDIGMPDMSYGWAKLTCEYLARLAYERHGLKSVTYRPFSGYGEDQDMSYPFPSICQRILDNKGASEISVWGSGDQMRDFIHISDCVRGVITTMDKIDNGDALNLSTGILTSFKQFAAMAAELAGYQPSVKGTSDKPEGVFARGGDTKKQKEFGFEYGISFREGVAKALEYLSKK